MARVSEPAAAKPGAAKRPKARAAPVKTAVRAVRLRSVVIVFPFFRWPRVRRGVVSVVDDREMGAAARNQCDRGHA